VRSLARAARDRALASALALVLASAFAGALAPAAGAEKLRLVVDPGLDVVGATLDMVDASATQSIEVSGYLDAEVVVDPGSGGGAFVSQFQAVGGLLELSAGQLVSFELLPPITSCFGTGGVGDLCDPASGFCTEPVGTTPGSSKVQANLFGFAGLPGGAAIAATATGPGVSTFPLFDPQTPSPDDNFKLTADQGTFSADGCALNEIVQESRSFGCMGCEADFWGFPEEATLTVTQSDPLALTLDLPLDHNLLVIGWSGNDADYGVLNLGGSVRLVPEPRPGASLLVGALLLGGLARRRRAA